MSAQTTFTFDSVLPNYVEHCLDLGAKIVKRTKGATGMILCPACRSEKGLSPIFDGKGIVAHECECGHRFSPEDELILTFRS